MDYQVIIVGCGPAGIFTALTLAENGIDSVILFDQGNELEKRERRRRKRRPLRVGRRRSFQ